MVAPPDPRPRIRSGGVYRAVGLVLASTAVLALLLLLIRFQVIALLLVAFAGLLLGVILRTAADAVSRWTGLHHGWSLFIVLFVLTLAGAGAVWALLPTLGQQFDQLADRIPQSLESLREQAQRHRWSRFLFEQASSAQELFSESRSMLSRVSGVVSTAFDVIIQSVVVIFIAVYTAAEPRVYLHGFSLLFPPAFRPRLCQVLGLVEYTLRWWILGQLITMTVIGLLTGVGLWLIGVPLFLPIAILAALFNFIPNFGPLISFIPAVLLALAQSPVQAGYVVILYVVAQTLEGYVLTPLIQRKTVWLPPALTILVQVLAGWLLGALGVILAAPLTAAGLVLVKSLYVEDVLGDQPLIPGEAELRRGNSCASSPPQEPTEA